jgi:hypothetical protein
MVDSHRHASPIHLDVDCRGVAADGPEIVPVDNPKPRRVVLDVRLLTALLIYGREVPFSPSRQEVLPAEVVLFPDRKGVSSVVYRAANPAIAGGADKFAIATIYVGARYVLLSRPQSDLDVAGLDNLVIEHRAEVQRISAGQARKRLELGCQNGLERCLVLGYGIDVEEDFSSLFTASAGSRDAEDARLR